MGSGRSGLAADLDQRFFKHGVAGLFPYGGKQTLGLAITSVNGTHHDRMPDKGWIPVIFTLG